MVKLKEMSILVFLTVVVLGSTFYFGYNLFKPKDDSAIEESVEKIIEKLIDKEDIDLTPWTPEQ